MVRQVSFAEHADFVSRVAAVDTNIPPTHSTVHLLVRIPQ
jgi:hypothetical protein